MFKKIMAGLCLLTVSALSNAGVITIDNTVNVQTTNFTETVSVTKFDNMGGSLILESVSVSIVGLVQGSVGIENLDAKPSTITAKISAELDLVGPLGRLLSATVPTVARVFSATSFDGTNDFSRTSGVQFDDLGASSFDSITLNDAATLAFFTGIGTADFSFSALAASVASGSGNLQTAFTTRAGADITIEYRYTANNVSEPLTLGLLGMLLLLVRRYFKQ